MMTLESYISFLVNHNHELDESSRNFLHHYHVYDINTCEKIKNFDILEYHSYRNLLERHNFKYYENEPYIVESYNIYASVGEGYLRSIVTFDESTFHYVTIENYKQYATLINENSKSSSKFFKKFKKIVDSYICLNELKG